MFQSSHAQCVDRKSPKSHEPEARVSVSRWSGTRKRVNPVEPVVHDCPAQRADRRGRHERNVHDFVEGNKHSKVTNSADATDKDEDQELTAEHNCMLEVYSDG